MTLSKILRTGGNIIFLAALYYLTGRAGLLLAVPPGYATVFWPASGFALAMIYLQGYKILPGVWIGSFLINFTTYYAITPPEQHHILFLNACVIGLGAMLQTFIGALAARRFVGEDTALQMPRDVFLFAFFTAPLSCLIAASVGVLTLLATGSIPADNALFTWATWYTGDTLGVLVFAPVIVLLCSKEVSVHRKRLVTIPLLILFGVTIGLFFWTKKNDFDSDYASFQVEIALIESALEAQFSNYFYELESIEAFFDASEEVTSEEFDLFVSGAFKRRPDIRGFFWVEEVKAENLETYLAQKRQGGLTLTPYQRGDDNSRHPLENRPDYFIGVYATLPSFDGDLSGFDFGFEERRRTAFIEARDSGTMIASGAVVFAPDTEREANGFVVFNPLYESDMPLSTIAERRSAFKGAIVGVFAYESIFSPVAQRWAEKGIQLRVHEHDTSGEEVVVYASEGYGEGFIKPDKYYQEYYANFGNRVWDIDLYREAPYIVVHVNWNIWYALAGSMGFTFFVAAFLLSVTGQTAVIEGQVREKTRELRESNTFLNLIMNNVPDMIFVKNENLELINLNESMRKTLSPDVRAQVQGTTAENHYKEEEFAVFSEQDRLTFANGYSETLENNTDYKGKTRLYLTKKIRFENSDGIPFLLGISRDVTKEKKAEEELLRSNKELEEFAYVASHDLKAPLRHISMSAGFLRETLKGKLDEKAERLIETMIKGTDRMQSMIESLLAYSRVGRTQKEFEALDLNIVISSAIKSLETQIQESKARIEYAGKLGNVFGAEALLERLFQNLIQNAIKYAKPDTPPHIEIQSILEGGFYEISITDNGIGIASEYADKVFQIFQRLHRDNEYDGVGIGLSICQRIVEFHKGRIWVDKNYQGGAKFIFTLPVFRG